MVAIGIGVGVVFGGAIPAPFTPLDLSPALWLDAADATTITASSGAVSQVNDKSGNGRNFAMPVAANQPTTGASTQNGLNVLDFAGDFLTSVDTAATWKFLHDGTDYVVAAVVKFGTVADPNAFYTLMGNATVAATTIGAVVAFDDRAASARSNRVFHTVNRGVAVPNDYAVLNMSADNAWTPNEFNTLSLLAQPSDGTAANRSNIYRNSGTVIANNTYTAAPVSGDPSTVLQIGSNGVSTNPLTGSIAELILVSGANATDANRERLRDYLATKWGL